MFVSACMCNITSAFKGLRYECLLVYVQKYDGKMPSGVCIAGKKFFSFDKNFKGKSTKNPQTFSSISSLPF